MPATSVFADCLDAIVAKIESLNLAGIQHVYRRKLPWDRDVIKPCVIVTPLPEKMDPAAGSNIRDDVEYPILVTTVVASNEDLESNMDEELSWRQQIARAFRCQTLADVDEVYTVAVQPGPVVQPDAFAKGFDVSALIIRCTAREVRGV